MRKKNILFALACAALCYSCYYHKEDLLYGNIACDTSNVTYSGTITGIIHNYACLTCHGGTAPIGSFNLETYAEVKAKVTDGRLFGAINHTSGYIPMPQAVGKMSPCDINKVKAWIDAGAPNN